MKKAVTCGYDGKNRLTAWNVKTFLQPLPVPDGPRSLMCGTISKSSITYSSDR